MTRPRVAAVIPTKNVAGFIAGAMDSLWFCDEIMIVDMHSTDDTRRIVESYPNGRYIARDDYIYGNFNHGVEQSTCEWIIRLDSDERLSVELQEEIVALLDSGPEHDVYDAPFTSVILGHPIRHGSAWEQPVRTTLFRKGLMHYKVRSEHEELSFIDGNPRARGRLKNRYWHFSMPSLSKFLSKLDYYTERDYERADPASIRVFRPIRLMYSIPRFFLHQYVWKRGYRDGYAGFAICALNTVYRLVHELKAWEAKGRLRDYHATMRAEFDERLRTNRLQRQDLKQPAGAS